MATLTWTTVTGTPYSYRYAPIVGGWLVVIFVVSDRPAAVAFISDAGHASTPVAA